MARRIRTHTNPLSYPWPIPRESWISLLTQEKPLHVDVGCGKGDFILDSAKAHPDRNYLGIEVRKAMSDEVNIKIKSSGLTNVCCVQGNATISFATMFNPEEVSAFYFQFPDPWPKERHKKRLVLQESALDGLYTALKNGGTIVLITDVKEVYDWFMPLLSSRFKEMDYPTDLLPSYWEKWHNEQETVLHKAAFIKSIK